MALWELIKDGNVISTSSNGTLRVPRNETTGVITYTVKYTDNSGNTATTIYATGSGTTCYCTCQKLSASTQSLIFTSAGGSDTVTYSFPRVCSSSLSSLTFQNKPNWVTISFNSTTGILTVTAGQYTDTTTNRTGSIGVYLGNDSCTTLSLTQIKATPVSCACNNLVLTENN